MAAIDRSKLKRLALALAGGATFALTAPPTDLYPAVLVGLGLLAASLDDDAPSPTSRIRGAFGLGAAWGTAAGLIGLRFVPIVIQRFTELGTGLSLLALLLLAAAQSLIWAIGAAVARALRRWAHLPFPLAFGAGVLVALSLPSIFLWSPAGLVSPWPAFVQLADSIGERGVSVLFAISAACVAWAVRRGRSRPRDAGMLAGAGLALLAALPAYGALRIRAIQGASAGLPTLRVGLVDQAVPPRDRWDPSKHVGILRTLRDLTTKLETEGADLTIWPEAAYPYAIAHGDVHAPSGARAVLGKDVHGPLLVGLITVAPRQYLSATEYEQNSYNSATLVLSDGTITPSSDKLQLLWFGEMVPGGAQLPWLRRLFQRTGGLIPGEAPRGQDLPAPVSGAPPTRMAVLNCYEDTLPDLGRRLSLAVDPELLVNITNDAWFYDTPEPELHARLSAMRAIELRLDLVRAVNMGVTSWIDAAGVVRASKVGAETRGQPSTLLVTPSVRSKDHASRTFYARWGDAPAFSLLVIASVISLARARGARLQPT